MAYRLMRAETCLTRRTLGAFALLALPLALSACGAGSTEPDMVVRYRTTVEVDTPSGLKTGSSVREVQTRFIYAPSWGGKEVGAEWKFKGEAVAVDIAPGQTLFALLTGDRDPDYAFPECDQGREIEDKRGEYTERRKRDAKTKACFEALKRVGKTVVIWPKSQWSKVQREDTVEWRNDVIPEMVRFKDIKDPKSVVAVDLDKLSKSFGPGVKLKRITMQLTNDAVTSGIEKRLDQGFWVAKTALHDEAMNSSDGIMNNPYFDSLVGRLSKDKFTLEVSE